MLIIPAIDLYQGQCVRLRQGQFDQKTVYSKNPLVLIQHYADLGAKQLHIVDLLGAKTGEIAELELIRSMAKTPLSLQVGGGIRSLSQASQILDAGVDTLVLGSIAITNPPLALDLIQSAQPKKIVLAIDVHIDQDDGLPKAATHGWQSRSSVSAWDILEQYQELSIEKILMTDIACDGMMQGPNFSLYEEALKRFPNLAFQASGGIRNIQDIRSLSQLGLSAVILGRLLYEGHFNLALALEEFAPC